MRTKALQVHNYAVLQKGLAQRVCHVFNRPERRAIQGLQQSVSNALAIASKATINNKSTFLLSNLQQDLKCCDWARKQTTFSNAVSFQADHFSSDKDQDVFAPEEYKKLLLAYCFANQATQAPFDAIDYLLLSALTDTSIYPGVDKFNQHYCTTAAWLANNDSEFFGATLEQRLTWYTKLLNDFVDLLALGFNLPQVSQEKIDFPFTDRPVIASDCFCGEISPLLLLPELTEKAGLVLGLPFMDKPSISAQAGEILICRGLFKTADGNLMLSEFKRPARVDYFYPFAPDWELNDYFDSRVPMPGDSSGVRLVEEAPLWEMFPPESQDKTPATLIEVYRTIPNKKFFIQRQKRKIAARLRYAFHWLNTDRLFIKPVNSLYGIGAFGSLQRSQIGSSRFRRAVDHIFEGMVSYDYGTDESGNPTITPPHYWGFQIQTALNPLKVTWQGTEYSHKIRALAALKPDGKYVFAGALAYLGKGEVVGGFNAEPFSLSDFSLMLNLPQEAQSLEEKVADLTIQAINALINYVKEDSCSILVTGKIRSFLGNPDFTGYQMDWLGLDLVVERNKDIGKLEIKIIEINDWRSGGAKEILIELQAGNPLTNVAPVILHKAISHFNWRSAGPGPGQD